MTNHLKGAFTTIGLISFLMIGFQNCGEQPLPNEILSSNPEMVQISDQWASDKVSFYDRLVQVDSGKDEVDIAGFCHRNSVGEPLYWAVVEDKNGLEVLAEGEVFCERAGFMMKLSELGQLDCDHHYQVFIQSESGDEDMMRLFRSCN